MCNNINIYTIDNIDILFGIASSVEDQLVTTWIIMRKLCVLIHTHIYYCLMILLPWRKLALLSVIFTTGVKIVPFMEPKIHHHVHDSILLDGFLSQMKPVHIFIPYFFKIHFYVIHLFQCMLHAPHLILLDFITLILVKSTNNETPHFIVFSTNMLFPSS